MQYCKLIIVLSISSCKEARGKRGTRGKQRWEDAVTWRKRAKGGGRRENAECGTGKAIKAETGKELSHARNKV
jgi:hypothetical protein